MECLAPEWAPLTFIANIDQLRCQEDKYYGDHIKAEERENTTKNHDDAMTRTERCQMALQGLV